MSPLTDVSDPNHLQCYRFACRLESLNGFQSSESVSPLIRLVFLAAARQRTHRIRFNGDRRLVTPDSVRRCDSITQVAQFLHTRWLDCKWWQQRRLVLLTYSVSPFFPFYTPMNHFYTGSASCSVPLIPSTDTYFMICSVVIIYLMHLNPSPDGYILEEWTGFVSPGRIIPTIHHLAVFLQC